MPNEIVESEATQVSGSEATHKAADIGVNLDS
jgi:hypothetical protein